MIMMQEERWQKRYKEVMDFIVAKRRNPSKYALEERNMLNWCKQQRKLINAGKLKPERIELFNKLAKVWEENKRVNQYV